MTPSTPLAVALSCHPTTSTDVVRKVEVRVTATDAAALSLNYSVEADMNRVRVPRSRSPRRADGLWRRTCFEAFLSGTDAPAYYELNFSPSVQWAFYRFESYRTGGSSPGDVHAPSMAVRRATDRLELETSVRFDGLPGWRTDATFRLALAAVIEDREGRVSCWSLVHPLERPDFHHRAGFLLEVSPSGVAWARENPDRGGA